jgi:hypothetical protein
VGDPRDAGRPAAFDAIGPRRPKAPDHRPIWFVLLASLTLLYGGVLLLSSLETWRDLNGAKRSLPARALTPAEEEIDNQLAAASERVAAAHARTLRANVAASVPMALLLLFAAAATLSRDRRGRAVTLAAAWTGIAYQLTRLWLTFPFNRDLAREWSPLLARLAALQPGGADPHMTPEAIANVFVAIPVFVAVVAIGGSLVVIRYFGGRRGRVLYGLERAGGKP